MQAANATAAGAVPLGPSDGSASGAASSSSAQLGAFRGPTEDGGQGGTAAAAGWASSQVREKPTVSAIQDAGFLAATTTAPSTAQELADCENEVTILLAEVERLKAEVKLAHSHLDKLGSPVWWHHTFYALCCVTLAALAAGLTMGLVSIDPMEMKIIVNTEDKDLIDEKDKLKLKEDQAAAKRVLPLINNHHRLLVTLLVMNSLANESLPLFLDKIVPTWAAIFLSVTLVLIFGEIIPSAIFTGSEQLRIAAKFAPLVSFVQMLLAPIAAPIAKVLDYLLGEDHKGRYNFAELRAIVGIHARLNQDGDPSYVTFKSHDDKGLGVITSEKPHHFTDETVVIFTSSPKHPAESTKLEQSQVFYYVTPCEPLYGRDPACTFKLYAHEARRACDLITFKEGELTSGAFVVQERDEIKIMHGVMKLTHMCACDAVTPLSQVSMLEVDDVLSKEKLQEVLELGRSRLPVYSGDRHNIRGFILSRRMIVVVPEDKMQVSNCDVQPLVLVPPDIGMLDLLNKFQADRTHMALITNDPEVVAKAWAEKTVIPPDVHMMGIITLEDIIEKLIQEDIYDEYDDGCHNMSFENSPTESSPLARSAEEEPLKTLISKEQLSISNKNRSLSESWVRKPPRPSAKAGALSKRVELGIGKGGLSELGEPLLEAPAPPFSSV